MCYNYYGTTGQGAGRAGQAAGRAAARGHATVEQGWLGLTASPVGAQSHGDDVAEGLKSALIRIFHGRNVSKQLICVTE
jgi:hypothetical protein